jgi:hypothetical protein
MRGENMREKQYAAFAANAKTLDSLRRNEVSYVPGVFEVAKVSHSEQRGF